MAIKVGEKDLFPYLGDYGPVSIYKGEQKLAGYKWAEKSGQELHFDNTYNSHVQVEVDGQSYQHAAPTPDNPSEIHSLSDFDVVSSIGKRNYWAIAKKPWFSYLEHMGGGVFTNVSTLTSFAFMTMSELEVDVGEEYTLSFEIKVLDESTQFINNTLIPRARHNRPTLVKDEWVKVFGTFDYTAENARQHAHIYFTQIPSSGSMEFRSFKLEKGNTATPYIPAPEDITKNSNHPLIDKVNLSLSEPLRSVGDVKDRIFRDSGGLWKVERNVGYILLDGNQTLTVEHVLENTCRVRYQPGVQLIHIPMSDGLVKTSRFKTVHNTSNWRQDRELVEQDHSMVSIRINRGRLNGVTSSDVNNWFRSNHTEVLYTPSTPTIETLDQELQDKLNTLKSFKGSNYVYTVLPDDDLTPTIHAKTEVKDI